MKNNKKFKGVLAILLALIMTLALLQTAVAAEQEFPLLAMTGELVADANTQYIAEFRQNAATKVITASFMIKNGGSGATARPLQIQGIAFEVSFSDKVAPYNRYNNTIYQGALNTNEADFAKYCNLLTIEKEKDKIQGLTKIGSNAFRNDSGGRFIGAAVNAEEDDAALSIAPGATFTVAELFFRPLNGTDVINLDMFRFQFVDGSQDRGLGLIKLSTWLGNGSRFLMANSKAAAATDTYVLNKPASPSFFLHVVQPAPTGLSANKNNMSITGYNASTMEWSYDATGSYASTLPANGFPASTSTVYVRTQGSAYSGNDANYGNYKKYLPSDPVTISFGNTITPQVKVTFNYNYSGSPPEPFTDRYVNKGASLDSLPSGLSRANYRFVEWRTSPSPTGGSEFTTDTLVTDDITVYARWQEESPVVPPVTGTTIYVYFDANNGVFNDNTARKTVTIKTAGETAQIPDPNPSRSNYNFTGWNTKQDGTGSVFTSSTPVTATITVFAQWTYIGGTPPVTTIVDNNVPLSGFTADHIPFISGYPDGTMKPDNAITRAEVAMIFYRLLTDPDKTTPRANAFSDVPDLSANIWYTQPVNYLASKDILKGYPDGTFGPNRPITRAEFAVVASRFDKLDETVTNAFPDVEHHWAKPFINSAYAKGWVNGYPEDGTFRPQRNISRAEVVKVVNTMLNRRLRITDLRADILAGIIKFSDIEGHWAYSDIVEAANNHDYTRRSDGYEDWTRLK
jgi:uncharacterized repeat protein (TIGR02543 family)